MKTEEQIRKILVAEVNERIVARELPLLPSINDDSGLADLGLDSLDIVELWLNSEEKLGFEMPESEVRSCQNFGQLVQIAVESQNKKDIA
jgi:acyl carrier protein